MKTFLQIILILLAIAGALYLGRMMHQVVGYMKSMSGHTVKMSRTIDALASDIDSMTQQIKGMHDGIGRVEKHIALMSKDTQSMALQLSVNPGEAAGISGVSSLEHHISKLNADITGIQRAMSADLSSMRQGVDSMSYDVRYMRDSLLQMSADIRRGSEAVSSPQQYFRNMFDYGR